MNVGTAGSIMTVERTLLVQLNPTLTDGAVRQLRAAVGATLEAGAPLGLVLDLSAVDVMDSYITKCIRDLAISARLMGVPTIVCGVQPAVADTLVEMELNLGDVRTALDLDGALRLLSSSRGRGDGRRPQGAPRQGRVDR
jgi:rsbT antagonist protein RsbS